PTRPSTSCATWRSCAWFSKSRRTRSTPNFSSSARVWSKKPPPPCWLAARTLGRSGISRCSPGLVDGRVGYRQGARMKLGYSTWSTKTQPIEETIRELARVGYDGVEIAVNPGWTSDVDLLDPIARKRIRQLLDDAG